MSPAFFNTDDGAVMQRPLSLVKAWESIFLKADRRLLIKIVGLYKCGGRILLKGL